MIDTTKLLLFVPTMALISATPGMCMTLAMTLGMSVGLRRTAWMMTGEVIGVSLVVALCGLGISGIMLRYPAVFTAFKLAGGSYMVWLGVQLWRSRGALSVSPESLRTPAALGHSTLAMQGFVTAIANPKGWAFFLVLLPPFLHTEGGAFNLHFAAIVAIAACCELLCMTLYASGGKVLSRLLARRGNVALINRAAGTLMVTVGTWLALG